MVKIGVQELVFNVKKGGALEGIRTSGAFTERVSCPWQIPSCIQKRNGISITRFGFSISKIWQSCVRNRRKEFWGNTENMDNIRKGYDIVVVSRAGNEDWKFKDLKRTFKILKERLLEGNLMGIFQRIIILAVKFYQSHISLPWTQV